MPYAWKQTAPEQSGAVLYQLDLWPHRSLPRKGFVWVIGVTAIGLVIPMLAVIGSGAMWGLLPCALLVIWALWRAIERSYVSGTAHERLLLSQSQLRLIRSDPGRKDRVWQTNPHWVRTRISTNGPVEDYLILTDGQREIELGAFLSPEERIALRDELDRKIASLR